MDHQYIIPFSKDIKILNDILVNFNNIIKQFNNCLNDYLNYQNEIFKNEIYNSSDFKSIFYITTNRWDDLLIKLKNHINIDNNNIISKPFIVFVFGGQGGQFNNLIFDFYNSEKVFKDSIDQMNDIMKQYLGYSVIDKVSSIDEHELYSNQILTQAILGMVQVSFFKLLKYHFNIVPSMIVGHSLGETVASYASEMIPDIETLCFILLKRGSYQQKVISFGGLTMWIDIGEIEFNKQFALLFPSIEISCHLSYSNLLISGDKQSIEQLYKLCKSKSINAKIFSVPASFHNSSQEIFKNEILNLRFNSNPPKSNHMSTVYGKLFNDKFYYNSKYMYDNFREPTRFTKSIPAIFNYIQDNKLSKNVVFFDIGCKPSLLNYIRKLIPNDSNYFSSISLLSSIQNSNNNNKSTTESLYNTIKYIKSIGYSDLINYSNYNNNNNNNNNNKQS